MESMKHQNDQKMSQINRISRSLKLASKYLSSLLLLAALLTCSSLLPVMIRTVEFFTLINKNYMFLVCNGLVVFIVKNSGLMTNSHQEITSPSTMKETHVKNHLKKASEVAEVETEKVTETKKPVQEDEEKSLVIVKEEEEFVLVTAEAAESNENVVGDEVYEEDEVFEFLSAEELHQKCEDFIAKMKEEIRHESRQLIPSIIIRI